MKRFIFCLLIWAIYASANTCTEALFTLQAYPFLTEGGSSYLDSLYNNRFGESILSSKYIYENGVPNRIITEYKKDARTTTSLFYNTDDESVLTGKGTEILFYASTVEDTTISTQRHYSNGKLDETNVHKATKRYTSEIVKSEYENVFAEYHFINDTLVNSTIYNYNTDSAQTFTMHYVGDPIDENKCFEYAADTVKSTFTYIANDHGFSLRKEDGDTIWEFFITKIEGTTAIHQRRAPVKISPKARYFDLLGRYKFTK